MSPVNKAGTHGTCLKSNCLYLSPAPADFSNTPIDRDGIVGSIDEVCLSLNALTLKAMSEGARKAFSVVNIGNCCLLFVFSMMCVFYLIKGIFVENIIGTIWLFFWLWLPLMLLFSYGITSAYRKRSRAYRYNLPVIFNRQRREIYFPQRADAHESDRVRKHNDKKGMMKLNHLIIPWDEVETCIVKNTVYSSHGAIGFSGFVLSGQQPEKYGDFIAQLNIPTDHPALGLNLWQYLYNFMEKGSDAIPDPNSKANETALDMYHSENERYRQWAKDEPKEAWRWTYRKRGNWFSFGSLPYRLADRTARQPRAELPDWVKEWKKPIPEDQWAKRQVPIKVFTTDEASQLLGAI